VLETAYRRIGLRPENSVYLNALSGIPRLVSKLKFLLGRSNCVAGTTLFDLNDNSGLCLRSDYPDRRQFYARLKDFDGVLSTWTKYSVHFDVAALCSQKPLQRSYRMTLISVLD
jgi:hypothetical protein